MKIVLLSCGLLVSCTPCVLCSSCCDFKLDALGRTMSRIGDDADQTEVLLESFQDTCCPSLRSTREPQCFCETTPITAAGALPSSGSYCLARDVTGDITAYDLQVAINLNGHTVTGNVIVGEHGYVHDGSVTDRIILGSNSRVESVTVNALQGNVSLAPVNDVLVRNVTFVYTVTTP